MRPVVARSQPSLPVLRLVVPRSQPSSPDPVPVVRCCVPVVAQFFLNFCIYRCVLRTRRRELWTPRQALRTRRRVLHTRRRALRTRRRDPSHARSAPVCPNPISTHAFSYFPALSEHPGLHLPRRLLAGFSTGC